MPKNTTIPNDVRKSQSENRRSKSESSVCENPFVLRTRFSHLSNLDTSVHPFLPGFRLDNQCRDYLGKNTDAIFIFIFLIFDDKSSIKYHCELSWHCGTLRVWDTIARLHPNSTKACKK